MKLKRVAAYFNRTRCADAYTGDFLFKGQLDVYTEGVRDGVTIQRRVLELEPELQIPSRRCVSFGRENWIIGARNVDMFMGDEIRNKYAIQRAEGLAKVTTLAQALDVVPTSQEMFASPIWVRTSKEVAEDSEEFNQLNIYVAQVENVGIRSLVELANRVYIVKESYLSTAGFTALVVEMLDEPVHTQLQVETLRLDPFTQQPLPGGTYPCVHLRWQAAFRYLSQMTPTFERGDEQFVVPAHAEVPPGSAIKVGANRYRVVGTQDQDGVLYVHARWGT